MRAECKGLDLGDRRTKSEPVDYDIASEEHDISLKTKPGKKNAAANIAKWLKQRLVVGGTRYSTLLLSVKQLGSQSTAQHS